MPNKSLVLERVSQKKMEVAWPRPVSVDSCTRFLKAALGDDWRNFVTDPAGAQGGHQEAGTAEEGVVAAEAAVEERLEDTMKAALFAEAPVSRGASASAAGPFSPRPLSAGPSSSGAIASSAATAEARSGVNLIALKLEVILTLFCSREQGHYEDLQQAYTVNWAAELGQGTYGKVYVGTNGPLSYRDECQGGFAIKMLRDKEDDKPKGFNADAAFAADLEVRRHVALGLHPNVVGLVDVGVFRQLNWARRPTFGLAQQLVGPHWARVQPVRDRRAPIPEDILLHTGRHAPRPEQRSRGAALHPRQRLHSLRPQASKHLHARGDPFARLLWERGVEAATAWGLGRGGAVPSQQDGVPVPDPELVRGAGWKGGG